MANYADILVQYQTEIDSFLEALHRIDNEHGTYAVLCNEDVQPRLIHVTGEKDKQMRHSREITIDGIWKVGDGNGADEIQQRIASTSAQLSKHCQDLHLRLASQDLTIPDVKEVK